MQETKGLLNRISQHDRLAIMVSAKESVALPADLRAKFLQPNRLDFYYLAFCYSGSITYTIDMETCTITDGQLLFAVPHQILTPPPIKEAAVYYKIGFDENTLALLPQPFPFLMDPYHANQICFDKASRERVRSVFEILQALLHSEHASTNTTVILAHLNALLTELNSAYFVNSSADHTTNSKRSKYIEFKLAVETHLTEQQSVHTIAEQLATTTSSLYGIVKEFSGLSPKEFITNRLMAEAQRKLRYSQLSVKELAYELGYSDPDYFSRLFKKSTGKSVSQFLESLD